MTTETKKVNLAILGESIRRLERRIPESWAIIANNNGQGCVLVYGGGASLRHALEESGWYALDDLGLDDAPEGISVWEGRYVSMGGDDSIEVKPDGRFRSLTASEWERVHKLDPQKKIRFSEEEKP